MTPIQRLPPVDNGCREVPSAEISASAILSQILEGNEERLGLRRNAAESGLSRAISALPASTRRRLAADCDGQLESFLNLVHETNPESFFGTLLEIARDLEIHERYEVAGRIYMTVVAFNRNPDCDPARLALADRAQARLNFLSGQGTWRDNAEFFLRQTMEPSDWLAFAATGLIGRTLRFATTARLLRSGHGLFARTMISSAIVGMAEAPIFVMASQMFQSVGGRNPDMSDTALRREMLDAYRFFVPVRILSGLASSLALRRLGLQSLERATFRERMLHEGAVQIGILGGIYLAHGLQSGVGEDRYSAASTESLSDSARLYLQFNALRAPLALLIRAPRVP